MTLIRQPFVRQTLGAEPKLDSFTIRLNSDERKQLEIDKRILGQPKDGTALKQLAAIGSNVLHGSFFGMALQIIIENKRKNQRTGVPVDYLVPTTNVTQTGGEL
jgi:hypothetical protein